MNVDKIVDKMYSEMLKRCNVADCSEMTSEDTFDEDHINPLEKSEMTPECNCEQSGYGSGVKFERLRRITGYLVGDTNRWNNAKFAELNDRVKHM